MSYEKNNKMHRNFRSTQKNLSNCDFWFMSENVCKKWSNIDAGNLTKKLHFHHIKKVIGWNLKKQALYNIFFIALRFPKLFLFFCSSKIVGEDRFLWSKTFLAIFRYKHFSDEFEKTDIQICSYCTEISIAVFFFCSSKNVGADPFWKQTMFWPVLGGVLNTQVFHPTETAEINADLLLGVAAKEEFLCAYSRPCSMSRPHAWPRPCLTTCFIRAPTAASHLFSSLRRQEVSLVYFPGLLLQI